MWIARDKNGRLFIYRKKPFKINSTMVWRTTHHCYIQINRSEFPEVKWEDPEPTEVEIVIKKK